MWDAVRRVRTTVMGVLLAVVCLTLSGAAPVVPPTNLAPTPPMGWNSWNSFGCDINEQLIREAADALVTSGMRDAGYRYVNIDDCWAEPQRDRNGKLQPNHAKFPSGIKALADYVHQRGLKLGIYTSAGSRTCADAMPGSLGHERTDAQSFADWGVDYLKYDNCFNEGVPARDRYPAMGHALRATRRPIVYSVCEWGESRPWEWAAESGANLWRSTNDIKPIWNTGNTNAFPMGVANIIDFTGPLARFAGPGHWNDPDMLEVGVSLPGYPGLTPTESVTHFSMWAIMGAPLLAGNDVRVMPEQVHAILTNPAVIAVDQDPKGMPGRRIRNDHGREVWSRELADGSRAVALFNAGPTTARITTTATEAGLPAAPVYTVQDLWAHTSTTTNSTLSADVPAHGVALYRVTPAEH